MRNAPMRIVPYVAGARSRFSDLFYVDVRVNSQGRFSDRIKRVPRVRFYYGYDRPYMDMKVLAVYWTPRTPCQEGEEMYKHYIAFHWRPLFRFDWK